MPQALGKVENVVNVLFFCKSGAADHIRKTDPPINAPDTTCEVTFAPETVGVYRILSLSQSKAIHAVHFNVYIKVLVLNIPYYFNRDFFLQDLQHSLSNTSDDEASPLVTSRDPLLASSNWST